MKPDSKIYVAGHRGIIGSALCRHLIERGYQNIITCDYPGLDLTIQKDTYDFIKAERPEYVFLLAAHAGGTIARTEYPANVILNNILMASNIISASCQNNIKKLLFASSGFVYPLAADSPISESALMTGEYDSREGAYIFSKITGMKLCEYVSKQHQVPYFSVVLPTVFGENTPFDDALSGVVPALIKRFHIAKTENLPSVSIWGSGKPIRQFVYSEEIAQAMIFLMNNYNSAEPINVGYDNYEMSIEELAHKIKHIIGYSGDIVFDTTKPDGILRRTLDFSKMKDMGMKPTYSFEQGVQRTYNYYLNQLT